MMLREYGVDLYANVVFTTPAFAKQHPEAVRGFVQATDPVLAGAAADPDAAIAALNGPSRCRSLRSSSCASNGRSTSS